MIIDENRAKYAPILIIKARSENISDILSSSQSKALIDIKTSTELLVGTLPENLAPLEYALQEEL